MEFDFDAWFAKQLSDIVALGWTPESLELGSYKNVCMSIIDRLENPESVTLVKAEANTLRYNVNVLLYCIDWYRSKEKP